MTTRPPTNDAPTIAVCIASHRRPIGLAKLLRSLDAQVFDGEAPSIEIIVVQNDNEGTASRVVPTVECRWPVRIVEGSNRGISSARNTAIGAASDSVGWIVFIDDDEHASERWLDGLLACQREHGCDAVAGPVLSVLPEDAPEWIGRGGFFDRARYPTGTHRDRAAAGNAMISHDALRDLGLKFDDRVARAGGEDTLFFRRLHQAGRDIVWCDEAVVREDVPESRTSAAWICQRAYRIGTNAASHERKIRGRAVGLAYVSAVAPARLLQGIVLILPSLFAGRHAVVRQQRWIAYAAGLVVGAFGANYQEYRRTHGE